MTTAMRGNNFKLFQVGFFVTQLAHLYSQLIQAVFVAQSIYWLMCIPQSTATNADASPFKSFSFDPSPGRVYFVKDLTELNSSKLVA